MRAGADGGSKLIRNRPEWSDSFMERKRYSATAEQKNGIKSAIAEILVKAEDIHSAYIFGSFIDDDMPFRDIDLGVFFAEKNRAYISHFNSKSAKII